MSDRTPETGSHAWMVRMTEEHEAAEENKPVITEPITKSNQAPENWDTIKRAREPQKPSYMDKRHTHTPTQTELTAPED